jgi:hypothetical protein
MRIFLAVLALTLVVSDGAFAQNRVRTETIRPPGSPGVPPANEPTAKIPPGGYNADAHVTGPVRPEVPPVLADLARLPEPVTRTRARILAAARTGDMAKLLAEMQAHRTMPVFSFSEDKDPIAFWKANYPDSDGIEVLSILITILESNFVHVDQGTTQEIYLWPYFARMPLKALTPTQKVELFRIITGADYKDMIDFGAYSFYRLGIAPDGTWHFFVSGD